MGNNNNSNGNPSQPSQPSNPIIERALSTGFYSGGNIGDIGGGIGDTVTATGGGRGGAGSGTLSEAERTGGAAGKHKWLMEHDPVYGQRQVEKAEKRHELAVQQQQRKTAQRKIGAISRVETSPTGEVTYYSIKGQKYTFPSKVETKFTGATKFGGKPSLEQPIIPPTEERRVTSAVPETHAQRSLLLGFISSQLSDSKFQQLARQRYFESREMLPAPQYAEARFGGAFMIRGQLPSMPAHMPSVMPKRTFTELYEMPYGKLKPLTGQQIYALEKERQLQRYSEQVMRLSAKRKTFYESEGMKRIAATARFMTFGKPMKERGIVGRTAEEYFGAIMKRGIAFGGYVPESFEKAYLIGKGLGMKKTRPIILSELQAGTVKVWEIYKKPSTYLLAGTGAFFMTAPKYIAAQETIPIKQPQYSAWTGRGQGAWVRAARTEQVTASQAIYERTGWGSPHKFAEPTVLKSSAIASTLVGEKGEITTIGQEDLIAIGKGKPYVAKSIGVKTAEPVKGVIRSDIEIRGQVIQGQSVEGYNIFGKGITVHKDEGYIGFEYLKYGREDIITTFKGKPIIEEGDLITRETVVKVGKGYDVLLKKPSEVSIVLEKEYLKIPVKGGEYIKSNIESIIDVGRDIRPIKSFGISDMRFQEGISDSELSFGTQQLRSNVALTKGMTQFAKSIVKSQYQKQQAIMEWKNLKYTSEIKAIQKFTDTEIGTGSIVRTETIAFLGSKTSQKQAQKAKQKIKQDQSLMLKQMQKPVVDVSGIIKTESTLSLGVFSLSKSSQKQLQKAALDQKQLSDLMLKSLTTARPTTPLIHVLPHPFISVDITPPHYIEPKKIPPTLPPPKPPIIPFPLPKLYRKPKKPKGMKAAKFRYMPSLVAIDERAFGKKPKFLTGFEVRRIAF